MQNAEGTNRLTTAFKNGTPTHFGYDHNGNVTTIGTGYDITNTVYDRRNLPTAISKGSATLNYRYDHAGLRVFKQEGFNIHTLRGAFGEPLATCSNGSLAYWNILRPDGTVIGRRQGSNRLYYHRDLLGSTRTVVNASGDVEQTWDYYPFGLEIPGRSIPTGTTARERFTGHERDEEVGLDYMKARRYAPEFGRFLSVDPMADQYPGISPYSYALNNPLIFVDPTGMYVVQKAYRRGSGVVSRVSRQNTTFVRTIEGTNSVAGFIPIAGTLLTSQKMLLQRIGRDPSWQPTGWDYASMATLGLSRMPERFTKWARGISRGISTGGAVSNAMDRYITTDIGRDIVLFDVASSFGGGNFFRKDGDISLTLNEGVANAMAESIGLEGVDAFTSAFMGVASGIITGIANQQGHDLSSSRGRQATFQYYMDNKELYDEKLIEVLEQFNKKR